MEISIYTTIDPSNNGGGHITRLASSETLATFRDGSLIYLSNRAALKVAAKTQTASVTIDGFRTK